MESSVYACMCNRSPVLLFRGDRSIRLSMDCKWSSLRSFVCDDEVLLLPIGGEREILPSTTGSILMSAGEDDDENVFSMYGLFSGDMLPTSLYTTVHVCMYVFMCVCMYAYESCRLPCTWHFSCMYVGMYVYMHKRAVVACGCAAQPFLYVADHGCVYVCMYA